MGHRPCIVIGCDGEAWHGPYCVNHLLDLEPIDDYAGTACGSAIVAVGTIVVFVGFGLSVVGMIRVLEWLF